MKRLPKLLILAVSIILNACASGYYNIAPDVSIGNIDNDKTGLLILGYKHSSFSASGNLRYYNSALKKGIAITAIELINNTPDTLHFGKNLDLFCNFKAAEIISPKQTIKETGQKAGLYMLYNLGNLPVGYNTTDITTGAPRRAIFLIPAGTQVAIINTLKAFISNKRFYNDLEQFNIADMPIPPGDTIGGFISYRGEPGQPLFVKSQGGIISRSIDADLIWQQQMLEAPMAEQTDYVKSTITSTGLEPFLSRTEADSTLELYYARVLKEMKNIPEIREKYLRLVRYGNGNIKKSGLIVLKADEKGKVREYKTGLWIDQKKGKESVAVYYNLEGKETKVN